MDRRIKKRHKKNTLIHKWFESSIEHTKEYIKRRGKIAFRKFNANEYVNDTLNFFNEESKRKVEYIPRKFWTRIDKVLVEYLVTENAKVLIEKSSGLEFMLKNNKISEMKEMYLFLSKNRQCLYYIIENFDVCIKERGDELYKNKDLIKVPIKFIPELIKLKKEMDDLVNKCFAHDMDIKSAKDTSFSVFMNKDIFPKQLANYTDYMMKRGIKGISRSEIENELNHIISVFHYLSNKLIFQYEYNKLLSDRLINGKSLSIISEKYFISKVKTEAGLLYVNKMEQMIKDLDKSKYYIQLYKDELHFGKPFGIQFTTQVISQSSWEIKKTKMTKIEIPELMLKQMKNFENFYINIQKSHKLLWCYGLCKVEIQYLYLKKKYISVSTLLQYCILCALENYGMLSIGKIEEIIGCDVNLIINDIYGLIFNLNFNRTKDNKKGVVIGNVSEDIKSEDQVEINMNFTFSNMKFHKIQMGKKKINQKDEAVDNSKLKMYHDMILQMNITRIMKSRIGLKTTHAWLIGETVRQVELFRAQPNEIKEAIENLIEKQVIMRNEKERNCYEYLS